MFFSKEGSNTSYWNDSWRQLCKRGKQIDFKLMCVASIYGLTRALYSKFRNFGQKFRKSVFCHCKISKATKWPNFAKSGIRNFRIFSPSYFLRAMSDFSAIFWDLASRNFVWFPKAKRTQWATYIKKPCERSEPRIDSCGRSPPPAAKRPRKTRRRRRRSVCEY